MIGAPLMLPVLLHLSKYAKGIQVIGGNITVVQGGTADLPCKLTDTKEPLSQISWQRKTRGKPQKDNFFTILPSSGPQYVNGDEHRLKFIGDISDNNGSLQLSNVTLLDEGVYSCIFTLFPSGNHMTDIPLNVLVPPVPSVKDNRPFLGNEEVSIASCLAAGSRPPAEVKWDTGTLTEKLKATTSSTQHTDGTTTTVSTLFGVPTREINHHLVNCVVTSPALSKVVPFHIQVYFSPMEVNISERAKDSLECVTEANPKANISWSRSGQTLSLSAVRVEGAVLKILSLSPDLNGLYQCEATNLYGKKYGQLYVHVTSGTCTACWVLFGFLLVSVIGLAAAWWYFYKLKKIPSNEQGTVAEKQALQSRSTKPEQPNLEGGEDVVEEEGEGTTETSP